MGAVQAFEEQLRQQSNPRHALWHKVDLHNHTPASPDYLYKGSDAAERVADAIQAAGLSVVMFTDHGRLPDAKFTEAVAQRSKALILRGVELNVFVDAWGKPEGKVDKNLYFHLLIGFDPDATAPPDYWLTHLFRECNRSQRTAGGTTLEGISSTVDHLQQVLETANVLMIPAHLHSNRDAFKSRSIDDIYSDPEFLRLAPRFSALEVPSSKTAAFFDGRHTETGNLHISCIQSSDSHEPTKIGWRPSYVQMEVPSFRQLKAGLELPFRTSIVPPAEPASFIVGVHIQGQYLKDVWLTFSPYCNVFIGVKGAGKTSVLEALRFALGVEVPASKKESVRSHLTAILGPAGRVTVLLKRADGARLLVERSMADEHFKVTFADGRTESLSSPQALLFPTYILGWHEIEQAADDRNIRRVYLNTIAGKDKIRALEEEASRLGSEIRHKHELAGNRYSTYRTTNQQVTRLQELRSGLQALTEANLVELRNQYQAATDRREALRATIAKLDGASASVDDHTQALEAAVARQSLEGESPLSEALAGAVRVLEAAAMAIHASGQTSKDQLAETTKTLRGTMEAVDARFQQFAEGYAAKVATLTAEQRTLLESHRKVMEETKALALLEVERDGLKRETETTLHELMTLCDRTAAVIDERSKLRQERVVQFNSDLLLNGVRLTVVANQSSQALQELSQRYANGARVLGELRSRGPDRLAHLCLKKAYGSLLGDMSTAYTSFFDYAEFGYFLDVFEEDDLQIEFKVGKAGQEFSPINQLSAGQRCTAIFPVLLKLEQGPLIVDQPEDNLDNRHIASSIAPVLLQDKRTRQMMFTSHNANLVVLSDPESIVVFEGDGTEGRVECQGFLAAPESDVTRHVLDILDGGQRALEMRTKKYGRLA